jgi:nucleotide-binding universal stress UspA family protein
VTGSTDEPDAVTREGAEPGFEIGTDGIGRIVVGFDGSEPSLDALAFAAGAARRSGHGSLLLVYVTELPSGVGLAPEATAAALASSAAEAERLHAVAGRQLDGVRWEFHRLVGDIPTVLEQAANETKADAIFVGRSSSRLHQMMGSVAVRLVRHARRPIVVVP